MRYYHSILFVTTVFFLLIPACPQEDFDLRILSDIDYNFSNENSEKPNLSVINPESFGALPFSGYEQEASYNANRMPSIFKGYYSSITTLIVSKIIGSNSPLSEEMPIGDINGWHQTFADDFNGTSLDTAKWSEYEGQPLGDPSGYFAKSHLSVNNGILTIKGYRDMEYGNKWVTGGISVKGDGQVYGKYLVRLRMDRGRGIALTALLWPCNQSSPPEIDFAEDNGDDRQTCYSYLWYLNGSKVGYIANSIKIDLTQWHTFGVEWTKEKLIYTIDGNPWATIEDKRVPSIPMVLCVQTQGWGCWDNEWQNCPNYSTPSNVNMEIDWAVQYEPSP